MTDSITIAADDPQAQDYSDQLRQQIAARIKQQGGWLSFADYMHDCLYRPGLGYYSAGSHKLGAGGDFTTAPELTPLFGRAIAFHIADVGCQLGRFDVLEFGAGSGKLVIDVLLQLDTLNCLPDHYFILETSADLQQRQKAVVKTQIPALADRVVWLTDLPCDFQGVVLANEVCDAMPVHLLTFTEDNVEEQGISLSQDEFTWQSRAIDDPRLLEIATDIRQQIGDQVYRTEVNLFARDWLLSVADRLSQGAIFIIDYGYPFAEYYRPDRIQGTLRCYYRQQAHDDPFVLPGLQDITAHVDFTALAEQALSSGLDVAGFHEQSDFLLAGDITLLAAQLEQESNPVDWLQHSAALKQLLMPGAMGHQFKVLSLCRDLDLLPRLQRQDRRYQL
ncbi:class I SAM-dependent methyltransferase [Methylophaga sp. OBS1]|uniref:class I SAM-dependent methyltransferase n=1 Tax=Methylophaga sp. OBS1 TaxID=2991933 RepID=UPI0022507D6B|nr:SAM-dependent methyltransferase [Methylophaga sp. OBS1]MCX4192394.1 SAM-dependent methyltransferase [Methylophaga sp. OBS1]